MEQVENTCIIDYLIIVKTKPILLDFLVGCMYF